MMVRLATLRRLAARYPFAVQRSLSTSISPRKTSPVVPATASYVRFKNRGPAPNAQRGYGIAVALTVGGVGYYVVHLDYAPYTGRRRMIDMSEDTERAMGHQQFADVCESYRGRILPKAHPVSARVEKVGRRIAAVTNKDYDWEFIVVDAPNEPNAFCLPGGKVAVFTGLLPIAPNDDALASVLAHEIGHAVARHGAEKVGFVKILFVIQLLLATVIDTFGMTTYIIRLMGDLPYSRALEHEADYIGLVLMTKACYNPNAAPTMFSRLTELTNKHGGGVPKYLSTHPSGPDRISRIQSWLPLVNPDYESRCMNSRSKFFDAVSADWSPWR